MPKNVPCSACGAVVDNMMKCSGCHTEHYCDRQCQKVDWPVHKKTCKVKKEIFLRNLKEDRERDLISSFDENRVELVSGAVTQTKKDLGTLRFPVGTRVECHLMPKWLPGKIEKEKQSKVLSLIIENLTFFLLLFVLCDRCRGETSLQRG